MSSDTAEVARVDVRGPRFAAWVTTAVLAAVLVLSAVSIPSAALLLAFQAAVFALGAAYGPRQHPYGLIYAKLVAPRLSPTVDTEPVPPLRFAQLVGLAFAVVGLIGFLVGIPLVGVIAAAAALSAAFLNAAFGICLGCKMYPLAVRLRPVANR